MALVNGITKTEQMKTCRDFSQSFVERLENIAVHYDEVRLVFYLYIDKSLKAKMRQKRTKGKSTYYHIRDSILIQKIRLKHFLSNVKTKAELTQYLAMKCLAYSEAHPNKLKKFMVTSGTKIIGNTEVSESLRTHSHEEADTLLILHALTVDKDEEVTIHSLGQADPSQQVYSQLERFVCLLYKSKVHTRVNELRWFLFSNRAAEGESLPSTSGSLKQHVQRSQYMAMVWRKAAESHPSLPSPVVGRFSPYNQKNCVFFVIQAPNLAHMYINMSRTFSDIGPLGILSSCPPYWISKWPPFEIYICDYLWVKCCY